MSALSLRAPAKTNLFLEVTRRRPDGFHELDTVFLELELADELTLQAAPGPTLRLEIEGDPGLSSGPENLVIRAGEALKRAAGRADLGASLTLRKRIPQGGGLGGGSSDAAAALRGLDRLWGLGLAPRRLAELAAELGSDVAFFLAGGLQRGRGRGEVLDPLPLPPPLWMVLVFPEFPCPTPAVYRALGPHLSSTPRAPQRLLKALSSGSPQAVGAALFNRLEAPASELFPLLREVRRELEAAPECCGAALSGSGSTFLALTASESQAEALATRLSSAGLRAQATRSAVSR